MQIPGLNLHVERLRAPLPMFLGRVDATQWRDAARAVVAAHGRLVSTWGSEAALDGVAGFAVSAAYAVPSGLFWLQLPLGPATTYPDISAQFYFAGRMQRATAELLGITAEGAADQRRWLNHGAWPDGFFPLRKDCSVPERFGQVQDYPFVAVQGDGVHEIPVGPVHAGIIEPGHFRFSVVGEKVLRLEERLGYVHKGIERRFAELPLLGGHRLAARVSGDSAVAFSWAYCQALEGMAAVHLPPRAARLRAVALESERLANHLGDLGALGNDAGFAFGLTQFSRLKEDLLRANAFAFGARYLFDYVTPGGVANDLPPDGPRLLLEQYTVVEDLVSN